MDNKKETPSNLKKYWPLICLTLANLLITLALGNFESVSMRIFMGLWLTHLAVLKLFQPSEFVTAFKKYDKLAQILPFYASIYPILEALAGLLLIADLYTIFIYFCLIAIFSQNALSVLLAMKDKKNLQCACMGTVLQIPLSTVTLAEDIAMITMAALELGFYFY